MDDLRYLLGAYPALKDAYNELQGKRQALADIFDAARNAEGEIDLSKTGLTVEEIKNRNEELNTLKDAFEAKRQEAIAQEHAKAAGGTVEPETGMVSARPVSLGRAFVESEAFKGYRPGSGVGPIASLKYADVRNTLFQTSAGWAPESMRTGRVELFPTRPAPHVVDAFPQVPTSQAAVKYMEETTFTNAAAETAEAGAYPEAALVLTERSRVVEKVAVWLPVTDEQFEDVEGAEAYVNNRLPFMLRQRIDSQVLVGNGTSPNLLGTENVSGIQTQALGADPLFDAAYKLFRKIRDDGFAEPSVFFIRPEKWETARLARTADGIYILGNPGDAAPVRLWGVPGIETVAPTATKLVAGDYANFSELRIRRDIDIQVTNAHSDFFVNGKLAIRADVRLAAIHYRPKAFGVVTGL